LEPGDDIVFVGIDVLESVMLRLVWRLDG
jgi:hypothetical protein